MQSGNHRISRAQAVIRHGGNAQFAEKNGWLRLVVGQTNAVALIVEEKEDLSKD